MGTGIFGINKKDAVICKELQHPFCLNVCGLYVCKWIILLFCYCV